MRPGRRLIVTKHRYFALGRPFERRNCGRLLEMKGYIQAAIRPGAPSHRLPVRGFHFLGVCVSLGICVSGTFVSAAASPVCVDVNAPQHSRAAQRRSHGSRRPFSPATSPAPEITCFRAFSHGCVSVDVVVTRVGIGKPEGPNKSKIYSKDCTIEVVVKSVIRSQHTRTWRPSGQSPPRPSPSWIQQTQNVAECTALSMSEHSPPHPASASRYCKLVM